jgi:CDP-paratose 2-epimerase
MRPGSETNRPRLRKLGVNVIHGDIRSASDVEALPKADWVIDAAANPSVLAGLGARGATRQLLEHNLISVVNILEYCKQHKAGLLLLSSSRVYSIAALTSLPLSDKEHCFELDNSGALPTGVSANGINHEFSTHSPVSLYGSTKLASEALTLEYGDAFGFPVWVNRCGVIAGAGQFGTPDQGIFAFWVNAHLRRRPLKYIGFDGKGKQVRDMLNPRDLAQLIQKQLHDTRNGGCRIYTAGGGPKNAMSLSELNAWCNERFGDHRPTSDFRPRPYDIPWVIMDCSALEREYGWAPTTSAYETLNQIAEHALAHPGWLEQSAQ